MVKREILYPGSEVPHHMFYMAPHPLDPDSMFFQVRRAGETQSTPKYFSIYRTEAYAYNAVHCVTGGRGQLTLRSRSYELAPGQIFIIPAMEAHEYHSDPEAPLGLAWVEFCGSNSTDLIRFVADRSPVLSDAGLFSQILSLCRSITMYQSLPMPQSSQILYQIMMLLCMDLEDPVAQKPRFSSIIAYIDEHFRDNLILEQVARRFGYHPNYFSTLFANSTGMPFVKYITNRRMLYAADLLRATNYTVAQVSEQCGYHDLSNFYRHFHHRYGMSPASYRRSSTLRSSPQADSAAAKTK